MQYSYKMCALLGYYAAYTGNSLPTFRENLSVLTSSVKKSKKTGNIWHAVYKGKGVGGDRLSVCVLPENRVDTGGRGKGGKCGSSVLLPRSNGQGKEKPLPTGGRGEKGSTYV
jgi:hypothetical protein